MRMLPARSIRAIVLCAVLAVPLAGCESFDPTMLTDFIPDSKKKLPGERKDVFPQGVPGVVQGIPPDLVKGNQPPPDAAVIAAPEEPVEEKPKPKPKPRTASNRSRPPASVAPEQPQQQQQAQPQAAWPAPPPAR